MTESEQTKIGMFGGGAVGKTSITLRFLKNEFTDGYIPTIEDAFSKIVDVDGQTVNLNVIDTAGQDDFKELRFSYYNQVQGFVLVFDISNEQSIDDLREMYTDITDTVTGEPKLIIAANKGDLREENAEGLVPVEKYKELESEFKCKLFETSAKTGSNVQELYLTLLRDIISPQKSASKTPEKKESKKESGGEGGCCTIA